MYFGEREPQWLIFCIFVWNRGLSVHVKSEQVFRPMGVLNTFTELQHPKVKFNFFFYQVSFPPSPSSLLNLPYIATLADVLRISLSGDLYWLLRMCSCLSLTVNGWRNSIVSSPWHINIFKNWSLCNAIQGIWLAWWPWYVSHHTMPYKDGKRTREFLGGVFISISV